MNAFIQYLEKCLKTVNNENKEIYMCGDFNQEYYNLLCSFGLLPHIIQPTRIVENETPSVIDNIFSNNLNDDITAGNLLIVFSEHLSQFISVKKENIEYKHYNISARDYSKFTTESFRDDVSLQNFANKFDSVHDQFNDFFWKLEGCGETCTYKKT